MSINVNDKNLGHATAYAYYKAGGGTMTEAEFTEFMADFGTASQTAVEAAQAALASETAAQTAATTATNKATEATTAATTATTKAGEASTSASTATSAKDTAVSASQTATSKATEATTAAATATSAKTDAVAANTAAQSAKTAAQTAQTGAETAAASVSASAEQIATNAEDISQLKSEKADVTDLLKAFPVDTASGSIASFTDGAELPLKSLTVDIEPIQDLHGQESPYPAGGGKNKFFISASRNAYSWSDGCGFAAIAAGDSSITFNGTASAPHAFAVSGAALTLPAGTYTASMSVPGKVQFVLKKSGTQDVIANITDNAAQFTLTEETTMDLQFTIQTGASFSNQAIGFQIESGSTATAYAPYSNICPISGHTQAVVTRTGVNVWDEEWEVGGISDVTGQNFTNNNVIRSKNYIDALPNTPYYYRCGTSGLRFRICYYDADKNFISCLAATLMDAEYTTPSNCYYIRFAMRDTYGTTYNHDISINYPSTDTAYHPYTGQSINIALGQTVYGGTLDVLSGELVIDRATRTLTGADDWILDSDVTSSDGVTCLRAYQEMSALKKPVGNESNRTYIGVIIASNLPTVKNGYVNQLNMDGIDIAITGYAGNKGNYLYIIVNKSTMSIRTVADLKAWLAENNVQFCYELASPITVTLTPNELSTLLGANNIWSDAGEVTAEYRADPTIYIQKKIAEAISALS